MHAILNLFKCLEYKDIYQELERVSFDLKDTGITRTSFSHEVEKAKIINANPGLKLSIFKLEDFVYTRGDIHNFLYDGYENLDQIANDLRSVFSNEDHEIIRAMLTVGDYSLDIGHHWSGNRKFLGKQGFWEVILTASSGKDFFQRFLEKYHENNQSLESMISAYVDSTKSKDWRYHFAKYPQMVSQFEELSKDDNIFAWWGNFTMEKMGGKNLNAYHLNLFVA